ncbi:hypothetical protein PVA45_04935 [Entomospira entomophila]|uniref:Uncharacterized protein n=1 Tax=Entomospira entomophila TaxID=2719988 RepID=A0A968KWI6_9SPIO|nr:hypothetical protein [Entomospira entomophilus]NIZ40845.1 hypothetical protein [Entomospira entomophilus]WDI35057.1 hypothetical protein PVA45_04935 [Entomospira entomophilus]
MKIKKDEIIFELWDRWKTMLPCYPEYIMENRSRMLDAVYENKPITDEEVLTYFREMLNEYAREFADRMTRVRRNWKHQIRRFAVLYLPKPLYRWIKELTRR